MAQRSKFPNIPNVTTVVNLFEVSKGRNRIVFGDLEDLKNVFEFSTSSTGVHEQGRHFHDGNYSVSVLNYMEKKPVVVIHQENVDPCVVVKKTMRQSTATIARSTKGSVFYPFHWLLLRRALSTGNVNQTRDPWLVWKSGAKVSAGADQMKEIDSTGLLYFISDLPHAEVKIAYSSRALYKLTSDSTKIGFAVDLAAIFDANSSGFVGFLFEDPDSGSFSLVVRSSDKVGTLQIDNKETFVLSMSSCLYGRLIEFAVTRVTLSAACLKTIVRHCQNLIRLDVFGNIGALTMVDATEIVRLYDIWNMQPHLTLRSNDPIWRTSEVWEVIEEIRGTHHFQVLLSVTYTISA